jgi:hypothetical protein
MNVVEKSPYRDEEGNISLMDRINATLDFGLSWYGRMQAQETVVQRLGRVLGDEHVMLRNVPIEGIDEGTPYMVLIGPQGVRLVMCYPIRGVYRAKEDEWYRFNSRSRRFVKTKPNLQMIALNMQQKLQQLLDIQSYKTRVVEPVLIFTHPRTLIDSARPLSRVVSADAIEFFASNLEQLPAALSSDQVHTLVDAILYPRIPDPEEADAFISEPDEAALDAGVEEYEPAFFTEDYDSLEDPDMVEALDQFFDYDEEDLEALEGFEEGRRSRLPNMSRRQWLLLGGLAILEVLVIISFIIIVLRNTGLL